MRASLEKDKETKKGLLVEAASIASTSHPAPLLRASVGYQLGNLNHQQGKEREARVCWKDSLKAGEHLVHPDLVLQIRKSLDGSVHTTPPAVFVFGA